MNLVETRRASHVFANEMHLVETHRTSIVFANGGGLRPPQPPRCLFLATQACCKTYRTSIVFANGGEGCAPPNPPLFIFSRASVLQNIRILLKPVVSFSARITCFFGWGSTGFEAKQVLCSTGPPPDAVVLAFAHGFSILSLGKPRFGTHSQMQ